MLLWPVAILHDGGQTLAIFGVDDGTDGLCHAHKIAQSNPNVNPMFGSKH
jgi:hypothetical protein